MNRSFKMSMLGSVGSWNSNPLRNTLRLTGNPKPEVELEMSPPIHHSRQFLRSRLDSARTAAVIIT